MLGRRPFPWRLRLSFATDIARAIAYLHARDVRLSLFLLNLSHPVFPLSPPSSVAPDGAHLGLADNSAFTEISKAKTCWLPPMTESKWLISDLPESWLHLQRRNERGGKWLIVAPRWVATVSALSFEGRRRDGRKLMIVLHESRDG
jgi:hypothetical protein